MFSQLCPDEHGLGGGGGGITGHAGFAGFGHMGGITGHAGFAGFGHTGGGGGGVGMQITAPKGKLPEPPSQETRMGVVNVTHVPAQFAAQFPFIQPTRSLKALQVISAGLVIPEQLIEQPKPP